MLGTMKVAEHVRASRTVEVVVFGRPAETRRLRSCHSIAHPVTPA